MFQFIYSAVVVIQLFFKILICLQYAFFVQHDLKLSICKLYTFDV